MTIPAASVYEKAFGKMRLEQMLQSDLPGVSDSASSAPDRFSQRVPKSLGAVGIALWLLWERSCFLAA
jgi:hypothetical protein